MESQARFAQAEDVPVLVTLMAEFYEESGFPLPRGAAAKAFKTIIAEPERDRVWLIDVESQSVGYLVLTFSFSMEYGGLRGFVDDFFVRGTVRGRGLGGETLETARACCRTLGVRELVVETGPEDHPARGVYARAGFPTLMCWSETIVNRGHASPTQVATCSPRERDENRL